MAIAAGSLNEMNEKHFTTIYDKDNAALTTAGVAGETPWLECWDSALCVADGLLTDPPTFENAQTDELGCGYPNMCATGLLRHFPLPERLIFF